MLPSERVAELAPGVTNEVILCGEGGLNNGTKRQPHLLPSLAALETMRGWRKQEKRRN